MRVGARGEHRRRKIGWWLLPAAADGRVLSKAIEGLAARLGVPAFPPHVTLASGPPETLEAVLAAAARERPFELDVAAVETTNDLARTLALRFEREERVAELTLRLLPETPMGTRAPAHLSLVYAPLAEHARAELVRSTPPPLARVRFDTIAAMEMFTGELELVDIATWRELARVELSG